MRTDKKPCVVLGVTGGIAAYKACEVLRILQKNGCDVFVIMTENACRFLAPLTFETLCFAGLAVLCFHMEFYYGILLAAFCYPLISFWRHRANLVRLAHGEESRLWGKGSRNSGPVPKDDYEEAMDKLDEQSGVDLHHHR